MTRNFIITTVMATLLLAITACSEKSETPTPDNHEQALTFYPYLPSLSDTRGNNLEDDFAVVAWKNEGDKKEYVLRHDDETPYQVSFTDRWSYDFTSLDGKNQYLKYWDLSASSYTFSAYSPYSIHDDLTDKTIPSSRKYPISIDNDGKVNIKGIEGNVSADSGIEWLVALHKRSSSPLEDIDLLSPSHSFPTLDDMTRSVPLVFHSIMSTVEFRAYHAEGTFLLLSYIKVELVTEEFSSTPSYISTKGDYIGTDWDKLSQQESLLFEEKDIKIGAGMDKDHATNLGTITEIPQDMKGRWIKVTVIIEEKVLTGYFQLPSDTAGGWERDKKYIYTFALTKGDLPEEIILMDIEVENFHQGDSYDVDEPLNNW